MPGAARSKKSGSAKPDTNETFREFIEDQLSGLEGLSLKRMFGGYGLYRESVFFGILSDGRIYFKTDGTTRPAYIKLGSAPFSYYKKDKISGRKKKAFLKNYYEVPVDIMEDRDQLTEWARRAAERVKREP